MDEETLVATSSNAFAWTLYTRFARETPGKNIFFSPFSVANALIMTAEGARGETADEMALTMQFAPSLRTPSAARPWDLEPIHRGLSLLNARLKSAPTKLSQYEMHIANALWGEASARFEKPYVDAIALHYAHSGLFALDFRGNLEVSRQTINAWVENQTHAKITNLLPAGLLSPLTRLVLTNAVYFKGEWAEPFVERRTEEQEFHKRDGSSVRVMMMSSYLKQARYAAFNGDGSYFATPKTIPGGSTSADAAYPDRSGWLMVELPYKGGDLTMVMIAPQTPEGIDALEGSLTERNVTEWLRVLEQRDIHVKMPRFKLETSYEMADALKALGMRRAFVDTAAPNGAQFDGIVASPDPAERLFIGVVIHKAFVDVNEKGTEAAAATAIAMYAGAGPPPQVPFTPTFAADRPFLFLIRQRTSGVILFIGRVSSPV